MAHPSWALAHKTKGTELRNIKGRFYLYRVSSKWDKEKKVTRKITHELIGRITEEGLIPKGTRSPRKKEINIQAPIAVRESGGSAFLQSISQDILQALTAAFPQTYREIFSLAVMRLLHQSPLKNMQFLYESSMISEDFKDLDLSKNTLSRFMQNLGGHREAVTGFMKQFIQGAENIVFDTTHS